MDILWGSLRYVVVWAVDLQRYPVKLKGVHMIKKSSVPKKFGSSLEIAHSCRDYFLVGYMLFPS